MSEISAKLRSISFSKQKFQTGISKENWNLIKWIVSCAAMMTVSVPYVYIGGFQLLDLMIMELKSHITC